MRPLPALGLLLAAGLAASACGGAGSAAPQAVPVMPTPLVSAAPTPAVVVAWTPVVAVQEQAAQLEAAEEQYATCFAYAGLNQDLAGAPWRADAAVVQSCSTAGHGAGAGRPLETRHPATYPSRHFGGIAST